MSEPFSSLKRARGREEYEAECGSPLEDECSRMEAGGEAEESEPTCGARRRAGVSDWNGSRVGRLALCPEYELDSWLATGLGGDKKRYCGGRFSPILISSTSAPRPFSGKPLEGATFRPLECLALIRPYAKTMRAQPRGAVAMTVARGTTYEGLLSDGSGPGSVAELLLSSLTSGFNLVSGSKSLTRGFNLANKGCSFTARTFQRYDLVESVQNLWSRT